ncbi:MAG TPA: putative LPS assembly protein LptD [Chitinophagaceae bacterium]|nr:putative LPS assembly protein LptD [Chitinophagaceae bacterium]
MIRLRKFSLKYLFAGILTAAFLFTITWKSAARYVHTEKFYIPLTAQDTVPVKKNDSLLLPAKNPADTIPVRLKTDSTQRIDTFSLKMSNDSLEAPVKYEAQDSAVVMIQDKKILLYGKTQTDYQNVTLTAPKVELNQQTQIMTAIGSFDSSGEILERAHFKDGDQEFQSDSIRFNFKTKKGLTKNTYTQQGELFVQGRDIKKVDENTVYIKEGIFTTCDYDVPHFAFKANKMKVINKKLAVSGPAHPEFEGVPIPIYLPFGFYPLSQGRHSGLLPVQFTSNQQFGLGLEGIGYYKVLSDYWDVETRANVYSYGGWTLNIRPTYRKRYRYSGSFNLAIQNTKYNFKGDPDYSKNRSYNITWTHAVDSKAHPGTSFSASVNAGSTKYGRYVPNSPALNYTNTQSSSIAFSKMWAGKPYNLTLTANHSQNNSQHLINLSLPNLGFTVNTIYPLQKKESVGAPKWYEKLGIGYNGNFRNQVSFYDSVNYKQQSGQTFFKHLLDTLQWGGQQSIPISLSLPPIFGGAIMIAPNVSFNQILISQKMHRRWDSTAKKLDTTFSRGLFTDQQASFGIGISTALFGTYQFKSKKIVAIRHVIRPTFSVSYRPDLSKSHFYTTQIDSTGYKQRYSEFEKSMYGYYQEGRYGGVSFQLDNNLEMKVRSKKDTGENAIKKVKLIDGYGFSTSYNFFADSLKLAPFQFYFRTNLFEKINITANATLDPYKKDDHGNRINKYTWQDGKFNLGSISYGSISMSTSFQSKPKDEKKAQERKQMMQQQMNDPTLAGDQQRLLDYMRQNPAEFVDFNIPWSINMGFSLNFVRQQKPDYSGYQTSINSNLNFSGSFNLTPKWNFSTNGYYDFTTHKMQTFSMSISRDMHCWQMSINVTPIGYFRFYSFTINPKAGVLQDLRINRNRSFSSY